MTNRIGGFRTIEFLSEPRNETARSPTRTTLPSEPVSIYDKKLCTPPIQWVMDVPNGHAIMISFPSIEMYWSNCNFHKNQLYAHDKHGAVVSLWTRCDDRYMDAHVFLAARVTFIWKPIAECVNIFFSFHPEHRLPSMGRGGKFNCSVPHYWSFAQHLQCNLKVECEDGRDEGGHCPFSSPACKGWVASGRKCIQFFTSTTLTNFDSSEKSKFSRGARYCESLHTEQGLPHDLIIMRLTFHTRGSEFSRGNYLLRLFYGGLSAPNLYRTSYISNDAVFHHTLVFPDKTELSEFSTFHYRGHKLCLIFKVQLRFMDCITPEMWAQMAKFGVVCQFSADDGGNQQGSGDLIEMTAGSSALQNQHVTTCHSGELAQSILTCCPHNACKEGCDAHCVLSNSESYSISTGWAHTPLFTCAGPVTWLSYSVVCDFRQDCEDNSDEYFCQHPPCPYDFACDNGQCVPFSQRCDWVSNCWDHSDEKRCHHYRATAMDTEYHPSPILLTFDGVNSFMKTRMRSDQPCPHTHYRCPGKHNDCLPVYTRCNGWSDCPDLGDEEGCDRMTCPGFYRCFLSLVCVHADHLCDGWPHCPQRDDEWLCELTCPQQCLCQGHAFFCPRPFPAHLFPQLRYLDGRGSGMTPSHLTNNTYLVHLSLAECSLISLSTIHLPNLQHLDVSNNQLREVDMHIFARLKYLQNLSLANNPLHKMESVSALVIIQRALTALDLSRTKLISFDSRKLSTFKNMRSLNLSFTSIQRLDQNSFQFIRQLRSLYLAGSPVKTFPRGVLKPLSKLRELTAQTFKLCCKVTLPEHLAVIRCDAPHDEISSCEDLLRSGMYRVFLWIIGFLSLLGNMVCFVVRVYSQRTVTASGYHVFVANLCVSDFFMGIYITVIGTADQVFQGDYLHYEDTWIHSTACQLAGFLSLLSCEVSALVIWLITLDRFIVLRFPFSTLRFNKSSATAACLVTWLAGCLLAAVPLLPATSHWEFYSQTGICIPLPVTRRHFKGRLYSVSVLIVLNLLLFLLIAGGQAFIYWSVQKNALKTDFSSRTARDLTIARRLISVALTDFLCWFPIGLCGLLAAVGMPVSGEVNVALAVFVLPVNSALNPFVYTFNLLLEKRSKAKEALLLRWLDEHGQGLEK